MERSTDGRLALAATFAGAARGYWLGVFPDVCRERRRRRSRALEIPDPLLRSTALAAYGKWGNVEGAVAFAAFVPASRRAAAVRAMACVQATYDYLDMLSEQPSADPAAAARSLHGALRVALDPGAARGPGAGIECEVDFYEHCADRDDGGYLAGLVHDARAALARLPDYPVLAGRTLAAADRIVEFQSAGAGQRAQAGRQGALAALERWGRAQTEAGSGLRWWETAAASGSSLGIYALIALAASEPGKGARRPGGGDLSARAEAIDGAYFPWIGALHSLLDNLVDVAEDHATGQHNLVGCYGSAEEAVERMGFLAERARRAARGLPGEGDANVHMLILAAMASFYLSTPEARSGRARPVAEAVRGALGAPVGLTMPVFRVRLAARALPTFASRRRARGAEVARPGSDREPGGRARGMRAHEGKA